MIPKIIHYCWFGKGDMSELVQKCMASWRVHMPDWEYRLWDEASLSLALSTLKGEEGSWLEYMPAYVQEAYAAKKYAFVSDYVRLWALEREGGVYLDTDVEVLRSFEPLLHDTAFIGLEESKALLPGTCVMGCMASCQWVIDMLSIYDNARFISEDGTMNLTTNVQRMGERMIIGGLQHKRQLQYLPQWGLRIYTHDYFSPITSTRVMRKTKNTYSIHHFAGSWIDSKKKGIRDWWIVREIINMLVQIKRKCFNQYVNTTKYN